MAKGAGKSLVRVFASTQVTNSSLGGRDPGERERAWLLRPGSWTMLRVRSLEAKAS